jgi:low temperature requirement protein LtrA
MNMATMKLRANAEHGRKVTWLELFFDLVFVAAVSQVASPLHHDYSLSGLVRLTPLFALIWWAWTGHSVFSTRFDTDDAVQRGLTLLQMFAVAIMAANAKDGLDSRSSAGFAAAYSVVRLLLVAQYGRARSVPAARALATRYLLGHGVAALIWLASALVPAPERYAVWLVAFAIDLGTPWVAVKYSVNVPPDAAHLPERFGLFTLILLGESVVALMRGIESQEQWPVEAAISAFLGMSLLFVLWWWYFDGAGAAEERPVRTHRDAVHFHLWSYAHFPLSLGIVVLGVGIERSVTAAAHTVLDAQEMLILTGAFSVVIAMMGGLAATSWRRGASRRGLVMSTLIVACVIPVAGANFRMTSPVAVIALLFVVATSLLLSWLGAFQRAERFRFSAAARL